MKNSKGQALVEFVIILPITLMLMFCIIDFGRVISVKSDLESKMDDIVTFYESGNTLEEINSKMDNKDVKVLLDIKGDYVNITVSKKIKPITPEDAVLELKAHPTHNFLAFINVETGKVNVIHKLKDGKNYGLVEPEA